MISVQCYTSNILKHHFIPTILMPKHSSEVTIKFSELPKVKELPNEKVEIQLTDQNGLTFTALLNAKSWRVAKMNIAELESWTGAIFGKLGKNNIGLEVLEARVQIFESKARQVISFPFQMDSNFFVTALASFDDEEVEVDEDQKKSALQAVENMIKSTKTKADLNREARARKRAKFKAAKIAAETGATHVQAVPMCLGDLDI